MSDRTEGSFEGWVILEVMGHRKLGGYIKEEAIAGYAFVRLDVVSKDGKVEATQYYNPSSIYCITPCTQELAIQYGITHRIAPVAKWELPALRSSQIETDRNETEEEYEYLS